MSNSKVIVDYVRSSFSPQRPLSWGALRCPDNTPAAPMGQVTAIPLLLAVLSLLRWMAQDMIINDPVDWPW